MIVSLVTTFQRPAALARSLPQIVALDWPTLVVDDGGEDVSAIVREHGALYLRLPENRGLAAAMNAGLSYWLADKNITHINYVQDDCDIAPDCKAKLEVAMQYPDTFPLITGHDAGEHPSVGNGPGGTKLKQNCRATHLLATSAYWWNVMPIPTRALHAPFVPPGTAKGSRGYGSEVDHWITHRAPQSIVKQGGHVLCVPGAVRTFLFRAADSCWRNEQRAGEDPEFGET